MVFIQPVSCFHKNVSCNYTENNYIVIRSDGSVGICSKSELASITNNEPQRNLPDLKITPSAMKELVFQYMHNRFFISAKLKSTYNISKKEKEYKLV